MHDLSAAEVTELVRAAEAWRGDAVERGFSMALSRLGDPADKDCVVASAYHEACWPASCTSCRGGAAGSRSI